MLKAGSLWNHYKVICCRLEGTLHMSPSLCGSRSSFTGNNAGAPQGLWIHWSWQIFGMVKRQGMGSFMILNPNVELSKFLTMFWAIYWVVWFWAPSGHILSSFRHLSTIVYTSSLDMFFSFEVSAIRWEVSSVSSWCSIVSSLLYEIQMNDHDHDSLCPLGGEVCIKDIILLG